MTSIRNCWFLLPIIATMEIAGCATPRFDAPSRLNSSADVYGVSTTCQDLHCNSIRILSYTHLINQIGNSATILQARPLSSPVIYFSDCDISDCLKVTQSASTKRRPTYDTNVHDSKIFRSYLDAMLGALVATTVALCPDSESNWRCPVHWNLSVAVVPRHGAGVFQYHSTSSSRFVALTFIFHGPDPSIVRLPDVVYSRYVQHVGGILAYELQHVFFFCELSDKLTQSITKPIASVGD